MRLLKALFLAALVGFGADTARADVKPHPIFSDNMVLQQGGPIRVWGKADPGEDVTVKITKDAKTAKGLTTAIVTKADKDGNWSVSLTKKEAGTGYTLAVEGKNTVEFKNVAVGEVWICSGQSNMQWEFWRNNLGEQSKTVPASAMTPNIRLMTLKRVTATTPQYDFPVVSEPREGTKGKGPMVHWGKWLECARDAVQELNEGATGAERHLQREARLGLVELVGAEQGVGQRRFAQRQNGVEAVMAAPPAGSLDHDHCWSS